MSTDRGLAQRIAQWVTVGTFGLVGDCSHARKRRIQRFHVREDALMLPTLFLDRKMFLGQSSRITERLQGPGDTSLVQSDLSKFGLGRSFPKKPPVLIAPCS